MISLDQFNDLEAGDLIETVSIFPALTTETVTLITDKKTNDHAEFVVTYLGITLGRWTCVKKNGGLVWKTS